MSVNNTDLYLSNGTCYFGAGQEADRHFIPCGNAALEGPVSCCYEYDYCLSSGTCWDPDTVVTYIAGCTDPLFRADVCPQRNNYPDQQWVALARCDGADQDLWTGCAVHPNEVQIEKENCNCNKSNVLIQNPNGKGSFDEIGRLPNNTLQAITYNPTVTPIALPPQKHHSHLSGGAKAGIAIGVILGVALLVGLGAFLFLRRKKQRSMGEKSELDASTQYGSMAEKGAAHDSRQYSKGTTDQSELSAQREILEMPSPAERAELESTTSPGGGTVRSPIDDSSTMIGSMSHASEVSPDVHSPGRSQFDRHSQPTQSQVSPEMRAVSDSSDGGRPKRRFF